MVESGAFDPDILDGLLLHESSLRIEQHTTDTGGFTEIVFALCTSLGFRFVPRIRDLPATRLYTFDPPRTWPMLEPVIGGRLREQRIIDGWPDILRLIGSIRAGTVVPSHVITKLAANPRQSSLARALIELGRLEHTRFLLDLLRSPTLRHEMQASLHKGGPATICARPSSSTGSGRSATAPTRASRTVPEA